MRYHDYYGVLGVDKHAGTDEIREAFCDLAGECHGIAGSGDQAGVRRFNELNEAFDVLNDEERRWKYDALGHHREHLSEFTPPPLLRRGNSDRFGMQTTEHTYSLHVEGTGFSDFFENLFAFRYRIPREFFPGLFCYGKNTCTAPPKRDVEIELLVRFDEVLYGTVRSVAVRYPPLQGNTPTSHAARLVIPKGVAEGSTLRCSGLGEPGNHGEAGDLLIRVRLEHRPDLNVRGNDRHASKVVPPIAISGIQQREITAVGSPNRDRYIPAHSQLAGKSNTGRDVSKRDVSNIRGANDLYGAFSYHHDTEL